MSIFSKIKHGFEHLGHDIANAAKTVGKDVEKVGKGIADGVEHVGKEIGQDVAHVASDVAQSADELIHGHLQQALNKAMQAGQDLAKTAVDTATAGEQATVASLAHMHLSKKMDKAMGKAEGAMDKLGKGVATGVGMVEQSVEQDVKSVAKDTVKVGGDLVHGHFQAALNDTVKTAEDGFKTFTDAATAGSQIAVDSLANMHIGKGMDKAMGKLEKGYDAVKGDVVKSVDQVGEQVVDGTEGAIKGSVLAAKDAAEGHWGAAMGQLGNATMDALNVAADLTPEGAMASVGAQALANAHIGSAQLDGAIAGALHGNVAQMAKGIAKNVGEMELGNEAQKMLAPVADKLMPQGGSSGNAMGWALAGVAAGSAADGLRSRRGGAGGLGGGIGGFGAHSAGSGAGGKFSIGGQLGRNSSLGKMSDKVNEKFSTVSDKVNGKISSVNDKLSSVTGRLRRGKHSSHAAEPQTGAGEDKRKRKEEADDNAQNAANNTLANNQNQAAGGGDQAALDQLMLEEFMLQAGMSPSGGDAKKRREELAADS